MEKNMKKNTYTHTHRTETLCCTPETNTTLYPYFNKKLKKLHFVLYILKDI